MRFTRCWPPAGMTISCISKSLCGLHRTASLLNLSHWLIPQPLSGKRRPPNIQQPLRLRSFRRTPGPKLLQRGHALERMAPTVSTQQLAAMSCPSCIFKPHRSTATAIASTTLSLSGSFVPLAPAAPRVNGRIPMRQCGTKCARNYQISRHLSKASGISLIPKASHVKVGRRTLQNRDDLRLGVVSWS